MRLGAIVISARGGLKDPPPVGDRVKPVYGASIRCMLIQIFGGFCEQSQQSEQS